MANQQEQLDQNIKENWFSRIGVQKPYTVFVCIMAIIILGVFAFSQMQLDLFPNMNLPYAVVVVAPDETYLAEKVGAEMVKMAVTEAVTAKGDPTYDPTADTASFLAVLGAEYDDEDVMATALMQEAYNYGVDGEGNPTIIGINNPVAAAYLNMVKDDDAKQATQDKALSAVTGEITLAQTDQLASDILSRLSSVNGINNTSVRAIRAVSTIMVILEYNDNATVETADIITALNPLKLEDVTKYGFKYSNPTIVKVDPSALAIMRVTLSYSGENANTWLNDNVLPKIKNTVGVGSVSTNISSGNGSTNQDQAWSTDAEGNFVSTYTISIKKSSNAVTTDVAANVVQTLQNLKTKNAKFDYDITSNQAEYINSSIGTVGENLVVGGILAIIILFLFLRSLKMTLAIGISIPLALVSTFVFMYFMGINLNIVSMAGLALAVGMLVDNSVVVLENIFRLRNKGLPIKDACIKGASQIMMAMLASSLTTICVFFPMFFLKGMIMQIFTDLVWVVILSLLCSFVVAVMFLPGIVATFKIEPKKQKVLAADQKPSWWQRFTTGASNVFEKVLRFCINKKWLTILLALVLFGGSACLLLINGFQLMPATDEGTFSITATLSEQGRQVKTEDRMNTLGKPLYEQIAAVLGDDLDKCVIEYSSGTNTSAMLSGNMSKAITVDIKLKDNRHVTTGEAGNKVQTQLDEFKKTINYYDAIEVSSDSMMSSLVDSDVSVVIVSNQDKLADAITELENVGQTLTNKFQAAGYQDLQIISTSYDNFDTLIQKYNGRNALTFTVKAYAGADTSAIQAKLDEYVNALLSENESLVVADSGLQQQLTDAYTSMGTALIVGFVLIYLVMVAIFQSFLMPFIVLICVPLGFTGAFALLAMCGMPLTIPALIGFLLLMGVVINNGILAVDYTNQARQDGLTVKEALVASMRTRMRPIFMTALTTILAMVPMAFGWSFFNVAGSSALMQPLAVVSIGGLLFGTVTTLLVVPAFYALFCRDKKQPVK